MVRVSVVVGTRQEIVKAVSATLNGLPRMTLAWRTPGEVLGEHLTELGAWPVTARTRLSPLRHSLGWRLRDDGRVTVTVVSSTLSVDFERCSKIGLILPSNSWAAAN